MRPGSRGGVAGGCRCRLLPRGNKRARSGAERNLRHQRCPKPACCAQCDALTEVDQLEGSQPRVPARGERASTPVHWRVQSTVGHGERVGSRRPTRSVSGVQTVPQQQISEAAQLRSRDPGPTLEKCYSGANRLGSSKHHLVPQAHCQLCC
jgi:hypothetical protein